MRCTPIARGHFIHTPRAGQAQYQTQVGLPLQQLGIELIAAHSPQARGRKERLYGTMQGRWPQELRLAGVASVPEANAWLVAMGIPRLNARFRVPAAQEGTAFVVGRHVTDLAGVFSLQYERTVAADNTVQFGRRRLQIGASRLRCHFVRCRVLVHEHLDGTLSITHGAHVIGRFGSMGVPWPRRPPPSAVEMPGRRAPLGNLWRDSHIPTAHNLTCGHFTCCLERTS